MKILSIDENYTSSELYSSYGIKINTDDGDFIFLMDDCQCCCESFGYLFTPSIISDFIGAELLKVSEIITEFDTNKAHGVDFISSDYTCTSHFKIETSVGDMLFTFYNSHNGYYSHSYCVKKDENILFDGSV